MDGDDQGEREGKGGREGRRKEGGRQDEGNAKEEGKIHVAQPFLHVGVMRGISLSLSPSNHA